jgi:DNA-binding CsgD family transcriptional regulator
VLDRHAEDDPEEKQRAMMNSLFNRKCLEVLHASSVKDFTKQIVEFAQGLGFNTIAAMVVIDHSPTLTEFQTVTNAPGAYLQEFENIEHIPIDPVNQHCKRLSSPIVWNRQTYTSPAEQELWERQAPFGYRSGICFAMHLGRGRHYKFGANWEHDRCESVPGYKAIFEDLLVFGAHSQAAAFELSAPTRPHPDSECHLTNGELEALRWTMDGMTKWDVGRKMDLSEYDVTLRLQRAMKKLGCSSTYEAVLRAIKLGLIECV